MKRSVRLLGFIVLFSILSSFSGCAYFVYGDYPFLEKVEGSSALIYNNSKYIYTQTIKPNYGYKAEYSLNYLDLTMVGKVKDKGSPISLVYTSNFDGEENFLYIKGSALSRSGIWVKESFEFPDIYSSEIENIFVGEDYYTSETEAQRIYLSLEEKGLTYHNIIDTDSAELVLDEELEILAHSFFELKNYKYLKVGYLGIFAIESDLYVSNNFGEEGETYHKINNEYQEVFRNAIEELNEMQS